MQQAAYYQQQAGIAVGNTGTGFGAMLPPAPRAPVEASSRRGKGFEAKMGDRAVVRHKFSKDERSMEDGATGFVDSTDDLYGVDMLLGAGGMVRSSVLFGASVFKII